MNRFGDIEVSSKRLPPVYGYRVEKLVSLEQALQPIESQIDQLPYFIKIAKKHCHYPSEHGLLKDQSAAIYIYTMEWGDTSLYRVLNKALRSEDREALKIWFSYLKLIDTALDKLPTVKEAVWRGVSLDIGKDFIKDQILTWWSINSCSSSVNVIRNFLKNGHSATLFLIEAINGKKISGYTKYTNEEEVILTIGTEFRVKSDPLLQSNNSYVVHLIEIDDDQLLVSPKNNMQLTVTAPTARSIPSINNNTQWKQDGITIARGCIGEDQSDQLNHPYGLFIDNDSQSMYVVDHYNHRIIEWKLNTKNGKVVAGGNGRGNQMNELNSPTDVIVDTKNDTLIICDRGNRRVLEWSRQNGTKNGQILIANIDCYGITIDKNGYIYVSDTRKHEVRRWKRGDRDGLLVAGGNGNGKRLNQFNFPTYIFIDQDNSIYVSDNENHRVMKWIKNAREGLIVAGGDRRGDQLTQLYCPNGVTVDRLGNVYVADSWNHRIVCWLKDANQGKIIVGGNEEGKNSNQLNSPTGLAFDREHNLYVVDKGNNRVQKFEVDRYE